MRSNLKKPIFSLMFFMLASDNLFGMDANRDEYKEMPQNVELSAAPMALSAQPVAVQMRRAPASPISLANDQERQIRCRRHLLGGVLLMASLAYVSWVCIEMPGGHDKVCIKDSISEQNNLDLSAYCWQIGAQGEDSFYYKTPVQCPTHERTSTILRQANNAVALAEPPPTFGGNPNICVEQVALRCLDPLSGCETVPTLCIYDSRHSSGKDGCRLLLPERLMESSGKPTKSPVQFSKMAKLKEKIAEIREKNKENQKQKLHDIKPTHKKQIKVPQKNHGRKGR